MIVKSANLALRFLLELCTLAALGYWGFHVRGGLLLRSMVGIGAPLLAAVLWGTFCSPKAAIPLPLPARLLPEALIFGSAALALYLSGQPGLAGAFGLTVLLNRTLMLLWAQ